jgi:enoyl-[acyl-carrier-protein] reductase (NADH)
MVVGRSGNALLLRIFLQLIRNRSHTVPDVTKAIAFFISEEAAFITGCALDVDGGAHLGNMPAVFPK